MNRQQRRREKREIDRQMKKRRKELWKVKKQFDRKADNGYIKKEDAAAFINTIYGGN